MIYLKKQNKLILFLLAFIATIQIGIAFRVERLNRLIQDFEPIVIEQVVRPEETESIEPVTETVPEQQVKIDCPLDDDTQRMIYEKCAEYGLDFPFVMSVIYHESSFRPNVVSYNGSSVGLMQINKINHEWLSEELGITDFFDPEQNVTAGLYMLRDLFDKYENPRLVLMAYSMGETGARKLWNKGVYTTDYAENIIRLADKYLEEIERMG